MSHRSHTMSYVVTWLHKQGNDVSTVVTLLQGQTLSPDVTLVKCQLGRWPSSLACLGLSCSTDMGEGDAGGVTKLAPNFAFRLFCSFDCTCKIAPCNTPREEVCG